MIDIHHHCLPDVDDGPRTMGEAVELCHAAAEAGIQEIIATPHVLRERWRTVDREEMEQKLAELRARTGGRPRLHLGSEYFFAHDIAESLNSGAIVPLAGSRYVLVELASNSVPPMLDRPLHSIQLAGWTPILAHPERNLVVQKHPEVAEHLVGIGVKMQITAGSLTGAFGREARSSAERLLRRRLVHFVATDAHNVSKRPPEVSPALEILTQMGGAELAHALMVRNPAAVVAGRMLPFDPDPIREKDGLFTRLGRFFRNDRD